MSDDVPDLSVVRGERAKSDTEYIAELEMLSLAQEAELRRLRRAWEILKDGSIVTMRVGGNGGPSTDSYARITYDAWVEAVALFEEGT